MAIVNQNTLMRYWNELTLEQKQRLSDQLNSIDPTTLSLQQHLVLQKDLLIPVTKKEMESFSDYTCAGDTEDVRIGQELIAAGEVGCLLIAGGQGSRLQFDAPKGMYPISDKGESLFELCAQRIVAYGKKVGRLLPLAIMTSSADENTVKNFFKKNYLFGLSEEQLFFFSQGVLPFLDRKGNLFLEAKDKIAEGPDGNGSSLDHFAKSGIKDLWVKAGVRYLNYILIDNPLADPFDAALVGFHHRQQLDITIKCITRKEPEEKVGILIRNQGKVEVIEYSELPDIERYALNSNGGLKHPCANISLFCFSLDFIHKIQRQGSNIQIPLHKAFKATKYLSDEGVTLMAKEPMAWKFEKFIFDVLPFAERVKALVYPREVCFAPLKNMQGADSVETVRNALHRRSFFDY